MLVGTLPLQFLISVEPVNESSSRGRTIFQVSLKANGIERPLGEPVERFLTIDPKTLEFVVFVFPGNASLPANCQFSVRIWLRSNGIDHRIFGMDALWIGKDPDFNALKDASFARLKNVESNKQIYHGFVGKALVNYIVRWKHLGGGLYDYSMEYEGGGVGGVLFEDMKLRFEGNPRQVTFSIYTVPMESKPPGASHQLRVWLRSLISLSTTDPYSLPFNDSYIYQRIYKNDGFKIGGKLDFASLNTKVVMGFSTGQPQVIPVVEAQVVRDDDSTRSRSTSETKSRRNIDSYTGQ
ncbi:hypothetical protein AX16_007800 [Volvariella volvacea WC 439]|nr:hypothetical protein AX16_007800 [Volvariella volvacea WC 439]